MPKNRQAVALTIAGSDSGGGAGIQADLKTFAALRVHGTSAITCITAQNPTGVLAIEPLSPKMVRQQIEAVFAELRPGAVKSGMLYSQEIVRVVAEAFMGGGLPPLIVDPVMVSTSGARLLEATAIKVVQRELLPLASLATPNLDETEMLTEKKIRSVEEMRSAARKLHERFGCAALIKGGHMRGLKEAVDIFYDGKNELLLTAPFVPGIRTHGTGCTYSAAIAGYMALGHRLTKAVGLAKEYITGAIAASRAADGHAVLGHFWKRDYAA